MILVIYSQSITCKSMIKRNTSVWRWVYHTNMWWTYINYYLSPPGQNLRGSYCTIVCVSFFPPPRFLFVFRVCSVPALSANFPVFYEKLSQYYLHCVVFRLWCANGEGGVCGVTWVVWRCSWPRAQNYARAQFNVPTRGPMTGPIPAPCPIEDWVVNLCGSYVSTIS